jgi:ATP-dependent Clp protease ATP-binding subunit ClpC
MASISRGLTLAWQVAAAEAVRSQHKFIETGHVYIGICSLEKYLGRREGTTEEDVAFEAASITSALQELRLSAAVLRREIRRRLGNGGYSRPEGEPVSRSLAAKAAFLRVENIIVTGSDIATSLHLLAALLHYEAGIVATLLSESGVSLPEAEQRILAAAGRFKGPEADSSPVSTLDKIGRDLTSLALEGKLKECIGRDEQILRLVQALSRETKNNPLLIGDPGVGKSAIVEGLAWRIAHEKDPGLKGKRLIEIELTSLMAGTKHRGELEERIGRLIDESVRSPDLILFIDEIHTIATAQGTLEIGNLFKPALARGQIRCIGATTWEGYSQYIERDAALERRFLPIQIDEPSPEVTEQILREAYCERFAAKHRVTIEPAAVQAAVALSMRYLPDRRLPDKAIDILDESCARVALPNLGSGLPDSKNRVVTAEMVARVLADQTKLPIAALTGADRQRLLEMAEVLRRRVIGQDAACEKVAQMVQRAHAGLKPANRPVAVLLFVGPTGVGKTELAKATAEFLFGAPDALIRLDMSEYMEKHSVSRLIGAPPGFIGHDEEPQLTGALRQRPYSVVLIDEVEKAHRDVLNLFLQLFEEGRLTDSRGRTASGTNAIFILTSNVGTGHGPVGFLNEEKADEQFLTSVRAAFRPELWMRFDAVIPFHSLNRNDLRKIASILVRPVAAQLKSRGIVLRVREEAIELLASGGDDGASGARELRRRIEQQLEGGISRLLLTGDLVEGSGLIVGAQNERLAFRIVGGLTAD